MASNSIAPRRQALTSQQVTRNTRRCVPTPHGGGLAGRLAGKQGGQAGKQGTIEQQPWSKLLSSSPRECCSTYLGCSDLTCVESRVLQVQVPRGMDLRHVLGSYRLTPFAHLFLCSPRLCAIRLHDDIYLHVQSCSTTVEVTRCHRHGLSTFPTRLFHARSKREPRFRGARYSLSTNMA